MTVKSYAKFLCLLYKGLKQGLSCSSSSCRCDGWKDELLLPFQVSCNNRLFKEFKINTFKSPCDFCRAWFNYFRKCFYEIK